MVKRFLGFNPRARVRRDDQVKDPITRASKFQSTRPRKARPWQRFEQLCLDVFQSTRPRKARPPFEKPHATPALAAPPARTLLACHVQTDAENRATVQVTDTQ